MQLVPFEWVSDSSKVIFNEGKYVMMRNNGEGIILIYYTNLKEGPASERASGNSKFRLKNWLARALDT